MEVPFKKIHVFSRNIDYPDPLSPRVDGNLPIEPRLHRKSNNKLKFTLLKFISISMKRKGKRNEKKKEKRNFLFCALTHKYNCRYSAMIQVFHSPSNSPTMCPIGSISFLCFRVPLSRLAKLEIFVTVCLVSMASLLISSNFSFSFQNFSSSCFTLTWWNLSVVSFVCGKTAGTSFPFAAVYTTESEFRRLLCLSGTFSLTFKAVYMKKIKMNKKDSGSLGLNILLIMR